MNTLRRTIILLLNTIPFVLVLVYGLMLVKWGVDIPILDDWRIFQQGDAGSLAFTDLFRPANDTIYASGKVLEVIALKLFSYNSVFYQFTSLVLLLGFCIFFQKRLIYSAYNSNLGSASIVFSTIFMLQIGTYWAAPNIAYHQGLPILLLLFCLHVAIAFRWNPVKRIFLIATLSAISGFAYISGAVTVFIAAVVAAILLLLAYRDDENRGALVVAALGFGLGAAVTLPPQLWVILIHQHGGIHVPGAQWTFPWEWEFWAFFLGMVARAFGIRGANPTAASAALLLTGIIGALTVYILVRAIIFRKIEKDGYIYITLSAALFAYLTLNTASRAKLGVNIDENWRKLFENGNSRFHFFWLTSLIPWMIIISSSLIKKDNLKSFKDYYILILSIFGVIFLYISGNLSYSQYFKDYSAFRIQGIQCIQDKLRTRTPIVCPTLFPGDITKEVYYARDLGVSFTKYLSFPADDEKFSSAITTLYPVGPNKKPELINSKMIHFDNNIIIINGESDSQLIFDFSNNYEQLKECDSMEIEGYVSSENEGNEYFQVFFMSPEDTYFSEEKSNSMSYAGRTRSAYHFLIENPGGFGPLLRFDPGITMQKYELSSISVSCW